MAQPGGVLRRAGHTEAGCDLARLAGFEPAAVIVEILKEDGSMARRPDLEAFASEHGLKIGTIANLIHFRIQNEKTVERVADCFLPTEYGEFKLVAYRDSVQNDVHLAMIKGKISKDKPTLVRVHLQNPICDLTGSLREDCGWPLRNVLQRIAKEEAGVIVILCNQVEPPDLISQINSYKWQDNREDLPHKPNTKDLRTIGLGAQILSDLGVRKMRVLSAPKRIHAISGFGLEVVEYVN